MACPTGCATCSNNGFCLTCKGNWMKNKKNRCIASGSENCDECKWISMFYQRFLERTMKRWEKYFYFIFFSLHFTSVCHFTGSLKLQVSLFLFFFLCVPCISIHLYLILDVHKWVCVWVVMGVSNVTNYTLHFVSFYFHYTLHTPIMLQQ